MKLNKILKLTFGLAIASVMTSGCQSVSENASVTTAATVGRADTPKRLHFSEPRVATATYASVDRENSRFLKVVLVDYPIIRGYFEGEYTHVPAKDNDKVYAYQGSTRVSMDSADGTIEETVTGTVYVQRKAFASGRVTSDSLSYRFPLGASMVEPVKKAHDRNKPEPSSASASGSFAAIAAAAVINATMNEVEESAAAPILTFHGNKNEDFRKSYYGKNVDAYESVEFKFSSATEAE